VLTPDTAGIINRGWDAGIAEAESALNARQIGVFRFAAVLPAA
jgi:hypothetical protein